MRVRAHRVLDDLRRQWMGALALFLVLTGGVAYGANTIASSDIIDGEVKTPDLAANAVNTAKIGDAQVREADIGQGAVATSELKNDTILPGDVAPNSLTSGRIADATLTGTDVAQNSLNGADIDEATLDIGDAARAYARVNPGSCTGTPGTCTPLEPKGISSVTRVNTGRYCVTAPGIDAGVTPAAVTVDWTNTGDPQGNASAMAREGFNCGPADEGFLVATERHHNIPVDSGGGINNVVAVGPAVEDNDVGFTIVIP
jgi:hypothetical protein